MLTTIRGIQLAKVGIVAVGIMGLSTVGVAAEERTAQPPAARAKPARLVPEAENALQLHASAKNAADELAALKKFEELAMRYPDEWLAQLWTSYVATQAGFAQDGKVIPRDFLERAQKYLDAARRTAPRNDEAQASLEALQSFIESDKEKAKQTLQLALALDHDSIPALIFLATNLIGRGASEGDLLTVIAGKSLLGAVHDRLARGPREMTTTSAWNAEWIPFWTQRAETVVSELSLKRRAMR